MNPHGTEKNWEKFVFVCPTKHENNVNKERPRDGQFVTRSISIMIVRTPSSVERIDLSMWPCISFINIIIIITDRLYLMADLSSEIDLQQLHTGCRRPVSHRASLGTCDNAGITEFNNRNEEILVRPDNVSS